MLRGNVVAMLSIYIKYVVLFNQLKVVRRTTKLGSQANNFKYANLGSYLQGTTFSKRQVYYPYSTYSYQLVAYNIILVLAPTKR